MKQTVLFIGLLFTGLQSFSQNITGTELLNKAIAYHDPGNHWSSFSDTLLVTMEIPKSSKRESTIVINLPKSHFYVKDKKDTLTTEYTIYKGDCSIAVNGNQNPGEEILKQHNLSCGRAELYKNYYTYLYGLPMKLRDPGTIIDEHVERKAF